MEKQIILSVLVENRAGVLARVAGLFSRRGFNIESLSVGPTDDKTVSRMTILVEGDEGTVEQIKKQLFKLIDVIKIKTHSFEESVNRELALIKVKAGRGVRSEIIEIVNVFRAKIVNVTLETMTVELSGDHDKQAAFMQLLQPFGICEVVTTGMISIEK